ncbi:DNA recombination protein RmuC [Fundidesulfovibrio soli]|uniref:DNA recombination protein RmuC n=1 Tax=Fundidesulfovibrio soli TaxID=2922716 RepID=UPI001FAEA7B2|nr:DNA recombination protein RmuC [Fundidesulfovibrio soli]
MNGFDQLFSLAVPPIVLLVISAFTATLLIVLLFRAKPVDLQPVTSEIQLVGKELERIERALKDEISRSRAELAQMAKGQREELSGLLAKFGDGVLSRTAEMATEQKDRFDGFASRIDKLVSTTELRLEQIREVTVQASQELRKEVMESVRVLAESLNSQMALQAKTQGSQLDAFSSRIDNLAQTLAARVDSLTQATEQRLDGIREEISLSSKGLREETVNNLTVITTKVGEMHKGNDLRFDALRCALENQLKHILETTSQKTDQMRQVITDNAKQGREEMGKGLQTFGESLDARMNKLTESNEQKMEALRGIVEAKLTQLQQDNETKLEQMRKTVDEQLHGALEKRLGESFKLVSDRLEQVHKGLGEMQNLATGVGDLKRVLTNVKARGTWGEVQLERLLDQIFSPGQYMKNVCTKEGSREQVEFAVRIAGRSEDDSEMLLPIDSKCPVEDYERLLAALDANDLVQAEASSKQLENRLKLCGKDIHDKYLNPPKTTSYGVMFLPSEGLYAEALRRPGLVETLQREYRVVIAGPTTLAAILSSVQMGIAINQITKRSTEVWKILGAVKVEFKKYGDTVDKVRKSITAAANNLESVSTRSRAIERKLRSVEELPEAESQGVLEDLVVETEACEEMS